MRKLSGPEWGEASFQAERQWYGRLSADAEAYEDERSTYREHRERALLDPEYDLFDHFMPTGRPKYDIGRYVMRHNVRVPLIRSMKEWQLALMSGDGLIRSEHRQDYAGYSGLYTSQTLETEDHLPAGEDPYFSHWDKERTVQGPVHRTLEPRMYANGLDALRPAIAEALYQGTIDPSDFMRLGYWNYQYENNFGGIDKSGIRPSRMLSSRWRHVRGVNIRVMRDPVIEGKYFIGGQDAHHHWQITDGRDSGPLQAFTKGVYRGYGTGDPLYELPSDRIVDLYEKVRSLPFFDNTQVPVLELQYGQDEKLHFLQYLKTGLTVDPVPKFRLPSGQGVVKVHDVKGATSRDGERVRIYLDPVTLTKNMEDQAFWIAYHLSDNFKTQQASRMAKVILLDYFLGFKNNHFASAPLTRAPVTLGLYDGIGEGVRAINTVAAKRPIRQFGPNWHGDQVEYIDATVTSNGRQATIESDWEMRVESASNY
jgi:hypothetical protein